MLYSPMFCLFESVIKNPLSRLCYQKYVSILHTHIFIKWNKNVKILWSFYKYLDVKKFNDWLLSFGNILIFYLKTVEIFTSQSRFTVLASLNETSMWIFLPHLYLLAREMSEAQKDERWTLSGDQREEEEEVCGRGNIIAWGTSKTIYIYIPWAL